MNRPAPGGQNAVASLSLDLDNQWAYLRAAGKENWKIASSYLTTAADRIIDIVGDLDLPLTVFVVGRDLGRSDDVEAIRSFAQLDHHEFCNHSMNHLPWMHTMEDAEVYNEISETHHLIDALIGYQPRGFRGPGFSCPDQVLRVLNQLDYLYDASIFPTSVAPVARAVFLARTQLKGEQKEKAKQLYGGFAAMRNPNRPFKRQIDGSTLWEIPVTVMPITRTPIHISYFTYLAGFSQLAAKSYLRTAFRICQLTATAPSLLLHPPDFLGRDDDTELAFFPGMKMLRAEKLDLVRWALDLYSRCFDVHTMIDQVHQLDGSATQS